MEKNNQNSWEPTDNPKLNGLLKFMKGYNFQNQDEAIAYIIEYGYEIWGEQHNIDFYADLIQDNFQAFYKKVNKEKGKYKKHRPRIVKGN